MSDRDVRVILDASAIAAYLRESVDVGEVISKVADERAAFGVPILCLVEAIRFATVDDRRTLAVLLANPACTLLELDTDDWALLSMTHQTVGRLDAAAAAVAAVGNDCDALTAQPGIYGGLPGGGPVIGIE